MILKTLALLRVSNNYSSPLPTTARGFLHAQKQEKWTENVSIHLDLVKDSDSNSLFQHPNWFSRI